MSAAVGGLNLVLGVVYTSYGVMTLVDMKRGWRARGFSHFGAAWVFMAFTCGPHHLLHGAHLAFGGRDGGLLDLVAVLVGFPAGVAWFLLRVEAMGGGRGDRFVAGTPAWVEALPTLAGVYVAWLMASALGVAGGAAMSPERVVPNLLLIVLYGAIGAVLLRTQLANRAVRGGWSLSGLSLTVVFPTCGLMHGAYALYTASGRYDADWHGLWIDWLSVPAALYFLWVVSRLAHGALRDWNAADEIVLHPDLAGEEPVDLTGEVPVEVVLP